MVCGTGSDSGKSTLVTGLCRLLAREGVRVAPFKAQNMALNSAVTPAGHEIGRAQAAQAAAAGVEPEVAMNPVLLKPTDHRRSQVVVMGRPWATLDAADYQTAKEQLWPLVVAQLSDLRGRFDLVICEGAGSPAEINLLAHDITNLRVARAAGFPALVVGDIDRGGVFASLFGTVGLLPPELAACIRGFVLNKFRGDPALLESGLDELERRTGVPTLGVLPWIDDVGLDSEDSLGLAQLAAARAAEPGALDVAAIRLPRISNFTDLDALAMEPGVRLRLVDRPGDLGRPDLVVIPGTKATVADLEWLRRSGLADAIVDRCRPGSNPPVTVLGICGGYQMLGSWIEDRVEARADATVPALALLPASTTFAEDKVTRRVTGRAFDTPVSGYEIHHGRSVSARPWVQLQDGPEGATNAEGHAFGTSIHGLFENDGFRRAFLEEVARRAGASWHPGPPVSFAAARERRFDRLADLVAAHMDMNAVGALLKAGG
jgi:adenosylcobyric acid synthase